MSLNFFRDQIGVLNNFYDVTIISSSSEQLQEIAEREGVEFKGIEMKRDISLLKDLKSLFKLIYFFFKERPKVIHCNTPKASLLGLLAAYITKVPNRIYYIHGLRYEGTMGLKRKLLVAMEKLSCFCATDIIAVSFGVKEIAMRELTSKPITVIHNGSANGMFIDEFVNNEYDVFEIRKKLNINHNDFVYGFIGRVVSDKGINELISSFEKINEDIKNIKLLLVGRYENELDPLNNETKSIIENNKNIIEVGFQKDVKPFLVMMDVFVSPSYREGFGLTLLEANLMGKPVIASNITGYSEIIKEGKNGFFVNARDKISLTNKMKYVYENKKMLISMKSNCLNMIKEKYNHKEVLNEAINYYKKFI